MTTSTDLITMIIECKNCLRKFNLNEHILKPNGSNVRCTKCGHIFRAFSPFLDRNEQSLPPENEMNNKKANNHKTETPSIEKSMSQRIKVSVPASCISTDAEWNPLDFNIGRITDVSREGLAIEIFCNSSFEFTSISFITLDDKEIQINGKPFAQKKMHTAK